MNEAQTTRNRNPNETAQIYKTWLMINDLEEYENRILIIVSMKAKAFVMLSFGGRTHRSFQMRL